MKRRWHALGHLLAAIAGVMSYHWFTQPVWHWVYEGWVSLDRYDAASAERSLLVSTSDLKQFRLDWFRGRQPEVAEAAERLTRHQTMANHR